MKPPTFDIGYGVYRSFYFTEYVPPPPPKTTQTFKDLNNQTDPEEQSNILFLHNDFIFDIINCQYTNYIIIIQYNSFAHMEST